MAQPVQIGKYRRPGIFLEEFIQDVRVSPTFDGITNLVIGSSKKGPVNTQVLLRNINDLEAIFGPLDRQLERRGSFFHRTIAKMLESSPVFAINLLATDDALDRLYYQSLSTAVTILNDVKRTGPYRRFFDTTGFWKRDTLSFLNLVKDPSQGAIGWENRLLNFTNMSDRPVSIFIFKSTKTGYDRPLAEWYGGEDKIPPYVNGKDLASDYLVDVLVVAGEWSNYQNLSVDPRYSAYFSPTGLRKTQVRNFSNDRNVTTLAFSDGLSLIPYFRDGSNRNIFIETVINRNTDRHGVFCAFNEDLFETEFPNGLVDLIGNNLVGTDLAADGDQQVVKNYQVLDENDGVNDGYVNVDFLSYKERLTDSTSFEQRPLDRPGNVFALFGTPSKPSVMNDHAHLSSDMVNANVAGGVLEGEIHTGNRSYWFTEGYVNDLFVSQGFTASGLTMSITYDIDSSNNGYAVINGNYVPVTEGPFEISVSPAIFGNATATYVAAFVLGTDGVVRGEVSTQAGINPLVNPSDVVLGYAFFSVAGGQYTGGVVTDVTLDNTQDVGGPGDAKFLPLVYGVDFDYSNLVSGTPSSFQVNFLDTAVQITPRDYERYRRLKTFNQMLDYLNSSSSFRGAILADPISTKDKVSLSFLSVTNIRNTNTQNRSFVINSNIPAPLDPSENAVVDDNYVDNYFATNTDVSNLVTSNSPLVIYRLDDELIMGVNGVETKPGMADQADMGVVARYSSLYSFYEQGLVNTGDVIYQKVNFTPLSVQFLPGETVSDLLAGYDYIVFGVPQNVTNYLGIQETDKVNLNEALFTAVESTPGYQFLINTPLNGGAFKTIVDQGLSNDNPEAPLVQVSAPPVTNAGGMNTGGRAWILSELSQSTFGNTPLSFTGSSDYNYFAYEIEQDVRDEVISSLDTLKAYSDDYEDRPLYLDMFLDAELNLKVRLEDKLLQTLESFGTINISGDTDALLSNDIFNVRSFKTNYKQSLEIEEPENYTSVANKVLVRAARYTEVKVGDYLEALYDVNELEPGEVPRKLTRILSKRLWAGDPTLVEITCDSPIKISDFGNDDRQTFRYTAIDDYVSTYKAISLNGFRIRQASLPDGTETRQDQILNLVAKGTPLFNAIANKDAFDFRYLIDSYGLGLTERSKQQLVDITGDRLDSFGIINMPSMRSFRDSSSPTFTNNEGVLQTSFIASGGDPESNPAFLYSFAEGDGVTTVGYFAPYLTVNDNGRPVSVPPAAYVASTYMRKHNSSVTSVTPWTVAAGINDGRITGVAGLEIDFNPQDIENLNQAQMNPIVFKRNRGNVIETENTALTLFDSSLSYIHVREVLIELSRELADMLRQFQWKANTPEVRAEIKLRADVICETYRSRGGLYNYFNKCDEENNTEEIITNQIGVLDTYVEPIMNMGIIVNNITILRPGAIRSGGFIFGGA